MHFAEWSHEEGEGVVQGAGCGRERRDRQGGVHAGVPEGREQEGESDRSAKQGCAKSDCGACWIAFDVGQWLRNELKWNEMQA